MDTILDWPIFSLEWWEEHQWVAFAAIFAVGWIANRIYESRRTRSMESVAGSMSFVFQAESDLSRHTQDLHFNLFSPDTSEIINVMTGTTNGMLTQIFGYEYDVDAGQDTKTIQQTVVLYQSTGLVFPEFELTDKPIFGFGDAELKSGLRDIEIRGLDKHQVGGIDVDAVKAIFTDEVVEYFAKRRKWHVEGNKDTLIIYKGGHRISPNDMPVFLQETQVVLELFKHSH